MDWVSRYLGEWVNALSLLSLACLRGLAYLKMVTAQEKASLASVVSVNSAIMHGTPCFTGTRVPVQTLLDYIEEGDTLDSFLKDFPTVTRNQAIQFLESPARDG